jgi:ABC-type Zn2+ transport system substrate-binding protein/surface adhesin
MKNIILTDTTQRKKQQTLVENPLSILETIYKEQEQAQDETTLDCIREIKKKHSGYKSQDKQKHKYDVDKHITFTELIEKMIESKLKCYYCNKDLLLLYNKKKDGLQWTLERLNNHLGHYKDNTCISCLKCNLGRRTENHEYYKKGKTMILQKVI